jgi:hypothetical protein
MGYPSEWEAAMNKSPAWVAILGIILPIAALGLCSWAMESAKNRGRELPGGKDPALSGGPTWASGTPPTK